MKRKKHYSDEFRTNAVELSRERENIKELADELGITADLLYKWRARANKNTSPKPSSGATAGLRASDEVSRLQKQLKDTQLELEILKKAIHIFSKNGGKNTSL